MTIDRQRFVAFLCATALAIGLSGCGQGKAAQDDNRVKSRDEFQSRVGTAIDPEKHPGKALYLENCAGCHDGGVYKAPSTVWLEMMAPDAVLDAMNNGVMKDMAKNLSPQQRVHIAEYLARVSLADYKPPAPPPACASPQLAGGPPPAPVGWGHDNSRFIPASVAGLGKSDVPRLKLKWAFAYPGAVRARSQPSVGWGTVFVGGHDGTLYAFDLATGCARWTSRKSAEVRTAIVADAATKRLYFGDILGRAYAVDAKSGRRLWLAQLTERDAWNVGCMVGNDNCPKENGPDLDVAASPIVVKAGGREVIVAGQKSGVAHGIDPVSGKILWRTRLGHGGTQGGVHFGMAAEGTRVFVPINDMANTYDGRKYDAKIAGPGLHAVDAFSGKILWRNIAKNRCGDTPNCDPGISAAVTAIPGVVFGGHLDGQLRAYDSGSGRILWSYDTTQSVTSVNGATGKGGGMSGPGATVAQGHLVLNSGYGLYYHMPGNVLLVFAAD